LWTFGEPNPPHRPYICHAHEACVATGDVNGDGVVEVALADGDRVLLLDGPTGELRASRPLPRDNYFIVQILGDHTTPGEAALVVKNGEDGYDGWRYGEPVLGLGPRLEPAWGPVAIPGGGHHVLALDLDGDGRREFLIGYCLVKPDGSWRCLVEGMTSAALDPLREHVDYADLLALGDGNTILGLAGSGRAYCVRYDGGTLFVRPDKHVQGCALGRFRSDSAFQLAVYNDDGPLVLYDPTGTELWRLATLERWPLGMPAACAGHEFHRNRPIVRLSLDQDYILFTDGGWPWVVDGDGRLAVELEPPANSRQPEWPLPARARADDMGYGFGTQMVDWYGDGRQWPVVYDRRFLWCFAPDPRTSDG
jgi:outer membrane protein assembly factor BamB